MKRRHPTTAVLASVLAVTAAVGLTACGGGVSSTPQTSSTRATSPGRRPSTTDASPATSSTSASPSTFGGTTKPAGTPSTPATKPATSPRSSTTPATTTPTKPGPVIVLDPGHSPTVGGVDKRTGLVVSDYENEPEMRDVYAVALLVRAKLLKAGYRVVMTKKSVYQKVNLGQRAAIANNAHAALALSIHDQAGANGGIGFTKGNNTVYYQGLGTYRANPHGTRYYFTNKALSALSKKYGKLFQTQRELALHHSVTLRGDTGYDLGSRGLAAGDIWLVQLLSHVPWVYNEAGGNSAGRIGLSAHDKAVYAQGLYEAVLHCVPIHR